MQLSDFVEACLNRQEREELPMLTQLARQAGQVI